MFWSLISVQILTISYHQITTRFDFFPFNGVRYYTVRERNIEALVNGLIMVVAVVLSITQMPILVSISGAIWTLILIGAIANWWIPYATGRENYKMPNNETWLEVHERIFANTIHILPHIKSHPRPNLEHVILHFLILCTATLSWLYVFASLL